MAIRNVRGSGRRMAGAAAQLRKALATAATKTDGLMYRRASSMLTGVSMAANGEVEGPDDASGRTQVERSSSGAPDAAERTPRAHNVLQRPRRQTDHVSRPPRTMVRSHPHRPPLCAGGPSAASEREKGPALSAPREAINKVDPRLRDRCLTDAARARAPASINDTAGRARTSGASNEDARKTTESVIARKTRRQAKPLPFLRDA